MPVLCFAATQGRCWTEKRENRGAKKYLEQIFEVQRDKYSVFLGDVYGFWITQKTSRDFAYV